MKKVVIVGAGMAGLAANYALSNVKGIETTLIGRTVRPAESLEFVTGPHRRSGISTALLEAVRSFDLEYSEYNVRHGVIIGGAASKLKIDEISQGDIADFAGKTRPNNHIPRLQPGRVFADIEYSSTTGGLQLNWSEFAQELIDFASPIVRGEVITINHDDGDLCVRLPDNQGFQCVDYDHLILTIPRWEMKRFGLDENVTAWTRAVEKTVVSVRCDTMRFFDYDCVYLFDTQRLYRMTSRNGLFTFEGSGRPDPEVIKDDIEGVFNGESWELDNIQEGVKGYMLHSTARLGREPELPENVHLLGPYAEWQYRKDLATIMTDAVYIGENKCS